MSQKQKTRLTSLDIRALVGEFKERVIGCRVSNLYDINPKMYVFKLVRGDKKEFLLIENGIRMHLTNESTVKNKIPSGFTMKMRKNLRGKRVENVEQIGVERVVKFTFGSDDAKYFLILEFYASGNIVIADKDNKITQLIRTHEYEDGVRTAIGEIYPYDHAANLFLENFDHSDETIKNLLISAEENAGKDKKEDKKGAKRLRDVIFKLVPCLHLGAVDDILEFHNLNPNAKINLGFGSQVKQVLEFTMEFVKNLGKIDKKGYITYGLKKAVPKPAAGQEVEQGKTDETEEQLLDFAPYRLKEKEGVKYKITDDFNTSVEFFFSKISPVQAQKEDKEKIAWRKFENIKDDQEKRLKKLQEEQEELSYKAYLIEKNIEDVDAVIQIVRTMVDMGLSWDKIWKMINDGKKSGDPMANLVSRIDMKQNLLYLLLGDPDDLEAQLMEVDIEVTVSAFMNAKRFYEEKKKCGTKEKKTLEATNIALKQAEKSAMAEIKKEVTKTEVLKTRKTFWFEKFYWFITSENYLVLTGKDAQQNDLLVKRYLKKGDIYMHAEIIGAGSTVVKNPTRQPIPQASLEEAAISTICRSKAWDSKLLTSAWWVYDDQVSKTAPSGEYLKVGSFMIRGKKNFLNPSRMEMGLGILFKIDDSCIPNHVNDRKPRTYIGGELVEGELRLEGHQHSVETVSEISVQEHFATKEEQERQDNQEAEIQEPQEEAEPEEEEKQPAADAEPQYIESEITFDKEGEINRQTNAQEVEDQEEEKEEDDEEAVEEEKKVEEPEPKPEPEVKKNNKGESGKGGNQSSKNQKNQDNKGKNQKEKDEKEKPKNVPLPRGKKAKLKKIKDKYGEQDEEERQLRMQLMGSKEVVLEKPKPAAPTYEKEAKAGKDQKKGDGKQEQRKPKEGKEGGEQSKRQPRNAQPTLEVQEEKEVTESEVNEINQLIATPLKDDTIFFAVVVCAPYVTMNTYKYRVKLLPGTLKKGKAVKLGLDLMTSQADVPLEKQLIKNITESEAVMNMIGNVKVAAAGLTKLKQNAKQNKKSKEKGGKDAEDA